MVQQYHIKLSMPAASLRRPINAQIPIIQHISKSPSCRRTQAEHQDERKQELQTPKVQLLHPSLVHSCTRESTAPTRPGTFSPCWGSPWAAKPAPAQGTRTGLRSSSRASLKSPIRGRRRLKRAMMHPPARPAAPLPPLRRPFQLLQARLRLNPSTATADPLRSATRLCTASLLF